MFGHALNYIDFAAGAQDLGGRGVLGDELLGGWRAVPDLFALKGVMRQEHGAGFELFHEGHHLFVSDDVAVDVHDRHVRVFNGFQNVRVGDDARISELQDLDTAGLEQEDHVAHVGVGAVRRAFPAEEGGDLHVAKGVSAWFGEHGRAAMHGGRVVVISVDMTDGDHFRGEVGGQFGQAIGDLFSVWIADDADALRAGDLDAGIS